MPLTLAPRGTPLPTDVVVDPVRTLLARLPVADLPAFAPVVLPRPAAHRPPAVSDAVARAAACPDLFVVHAPDAAAAEPMIADLALAAGDGRTLVLSPDPVVADRLVERLARAGDAFVLRALADYENPVRPSAVVSRLTSAAVAAAAADRARRQAVAAVEEADARLTAIESLTDLTARLAELHARAAELAARRDAVADQVRAEADGETRLAARLTALKAAHVEATGKAAAELAGVSQLAAAAAEVVESLRREQAGAAADAAKKPGFFGRLLGMGKHAPDRAELEKRIQASEAEVEALNARAAELRARAEADEARYAGERAAMVEAEIAARAAEFDSPLTDLAAERDRVLAAAAEAARPLGIAPPAAGELDGLRRAATRDLVAAKEHAAEVERSVAEHSGRCLAELRVVVGTPASLHADPVFRGEQRGAEPSPPFSLLVLDRAEELSEHDFVSLARLAGRWVLVGDVPPADGSWPYLNGSHPKHPHGSGRNGRHAVSTEPPFAVRLARLLDREAWAVEGDRVVCRLVPTTAEQRRGMTCEPLLDRPEVELRFVTGDDGELVLAEVAFPAAAHPAEVKSFLFEQLERVLLRPCGPVEWEHTPNAVVARWPLADRGPDGVWIDLEPGVHEKVVGSGVCAFTAAVSFDPAAGWDAGKATDWLERHLPTASAGRFATVLPASRS